jgi:hypothetical protein
MKTIKGVFPHSNKNVYTMADVFYETLQKKDSERYMFIV